MVLLLLALLVVAVGPTRAEASSCSDAVPDGQVRVVVVVDPGAVGSASAACLVVPAGTTGAQALARRAAELGVSVPRYNSSGLLCAIDGHPASGCGDRNGGGYLYWAYFSGTSGSWVYGNFNPFTRRLVDGDIEGWRFVDGSGDGSEPPPRLAPSRSLFPSTAPPTTVPVTVVVGAGNGSPATANVDGSMASGSSSDGGVSTPSTVAAGEHVGAADATGADVQIELAAAPAGSTRTSSPWLPVAFVVVLIAALGAAAIVRSRVRR